MVYVTCLFYSNWSLSSDNLFFLYQQLEQFLLTFCPHRSSPQSRKATQGTKQHSKRVEGWQSLSDNGKEGDLMRRKELKKRWEFVCVFGEQGLRVLELGLAEVDTVVQLGGLWSLPYVQFNLGHKKGLDHVSLKRRSACSPLSHMSCVNEWVCLTLDQKKTVRLVASEKRDI